MASISSPPVSHHELAKQEPGPTDVICARGKRALEHVGNKRYKSLVTEHLQVYSEAKTKLDKSLIVNRIIDAVRNASPQGNFIRQEGGVWVEVGDAVAREKIGQSFRDSLHTQYKSSTKAKKQRKKELKKALRQKRQPEPEAMIVTSEGSDSAVLFPEAIRKLSQRLSGVELLNFTMDDFSEDLAPEIPSKRDSLSFRRSSLLDLISQPKRTSLVDLSNEKDASQRRNSRRLSEAVLDFAAGLADIHEVDEKSALYSKRSSLRAMIDGTKSSFPVPPEAVSSMDIHEDEVVSTKASDTLLLDEDGDEENDDVFAMPKPKGTFAFSMTSKPKFGNLLCMDQLPSFCKPDHVLLRQQDVSQ